MTKKKRIPKGEWGYFKSEKKRRMIITAVLFAVPLFIFFTSWIYFKNDHLDSCGSGRMSSGMQIRSEPDHDPEMQTTG